MGDMIDGGVTLCLVYYDIHIKLILYFNLKLQVSINKAARR